MTTNYLFVDEYITIPRGDTLSFNFQVYGEETSLDDAIFTIKKNFDGDPSVQIKLGSGISDLGDGLYVVRIDPVETEDLPVGKYHYDLRLYKGSDVFTVLRGIYELVNDATRDDDVTTDLITKTITVNGTYKAHDEGALGFSQVTVNVPQAVLTTKSITANGTYNATSDDADGYSSVTVNVPPASATLITKNITANGNYSASSDSADGYSSVSVAVPASAVDTGTKSISSNGTHDVVGYASASVSVPNTYSAGDEGKVVSDGALVSQTSETYTTNDTYDTTLINSVTVNVSGGGGSSVCSGTFTPTENILAPSFNVGATISHFLVFPTTNIFGTQSVKMFWSAYTEFGATDVYSLTSNNTGAASVTRFYQDSWFTFSNGVVSCTNSGTSGAGNAGYWIAGATYQWYAW